MTTRNRATDAELAVAIQQQPAEAFKNTQRMVNAMRALGYTASLARCARLMGANVAPVMDRSESWKSLIVETEGAFAFPRAAAVPTIDYRTPAPVALRPWLEKHADIVKTFSISSVADKCIYEVGFRDGRVVEAMTTKGMLTSLRDMVRGA